MLVVDYGQDPPTFDFGGSTVWCANVTVECPPGAGPPTATYERAVGGERGVGAGVLGADGLTIAGTYIANGRTYVFEFVRD